MLEEGRAGERELELVPLEWVSDVAAVWGSCAWIRPRVCSTFQGRRGLQLGKCFPSGRLFGNTARSQAS